MWAAEEPQENEGINVSGRLFGFVVLAFFLIFVGLIVLVVASVFASGGSGSVGVVIFIGPFPIVFGSGPDASWLILIGIIIAVVSLVFSFVLFRKKRFFGY